MKKPAEILQLNLFESKGFEIRFYPHAGRKEYAVFYDDKIERIFTTPKFCRMYIKSELDKREKRK